MYDVAVIGAGVIGCIIARELSRYNLSIIILEMNPDVACGVTKANSAIIHSGYSVKPGTLKAKLNVKSNEMYDELCSDLEVPFKRIGSLLVSFDEEGDEKLEERYKRGVKNKVPGLRIIEKQELITMEPGINPEARKALYAPTTGITDPWQLTVALAENAVENGVKLSLNTKVTDIKKEGNLFQIDTNQGEINAKYVMNCAGLYSDEIHNMVAEETFKISPKRGCYYVLDKEADGLIKHILFQAQRKEQKSVIMLPTIHGNILIGPTAEDIEDKDDFSTSKEWLEKLIKGAQTTCKDIPFNQIIRSFGAIRPKPVLLVRDEETGEMVEEENNQDFIINEVESLKGFFDIAGIKSPGLACAPAIAEYAINLFKLSVGELKLNPNFNPKRKAVTKFKELSPEEKATLIRKDSRYGKIVCRCEEVTEGEIVEAIHKNVGALTVDGVKRRVGSGLGRCQGSFCSSKVMEILTRELGVNYLDIRKDHEDSYIVIDTL